MDVALDLFAEKGYASVSTREIAQKSGVTEMTLFRKFQTKKQLIGRILKECWAPLDSSAFDAIDVGNPKEALKRCSALLYDSFRSQKKIANVLSNSPEIRSPEFMDIVGFRTQGFVHEIQKFLERLIVQVERTSGRLKKVQRKDSSLMAIHFVAHIMGLFFLEEVVKMEPPMPWDQLMQDLVERLGEPH
jgi:AcrR family transcriptional regulator